MIEATSKPTVRSANYPLQSAFQQVISHMHIPLTPIHIGYEQIIAIILFARHCRTALPPIVRHVVQNRPRIRQPSLSGFATLLCLHATQSVLQDHQLINNSNSAPTVPVTRVNQPCRRVARLPERGISRTYKQASM